MRCRGQLSPPLPLPPLATASVLQTLLTSWKDPLFASRTCLKILHNKLFGCYCNTVLEFSFHSVSFINLFYYNCYEMIVIIGFVFILYLFDFCTYSDRQL